MLNPPINAGSGAAHRSITTAPRATSRVRAQGTLLSTIGLTTIVAIALFVRLYGGTTWGLPDRYHPDEGFVLDRATQMVESGNLNPHWFRYPTGYIYLQAAVAPAGAAFQPLFDGAYEDNSAEAARELAIGRALTALIGAFSVVGVFWAGNRLQGRLAAFTGAALVAVHVPHLQNSQWVTTDVPAAAAVLLVACYTIAATQSSSIRPLLLAGLLSGVAASMKYNAGAAVVMPLVAACMMPTASKRAMLLVAVAMLAAAGFLVLTPFSLVEPHRFIEDVRFEMDHYRSGHAGAEGGAWRWYPMTLASSLTGATILGGMIVAAMRRSRHEVALLSFVALYSLLILTQTVRFERNLMPLVPIGAVLAGASIGHVWRTMPEFTRATGRVLLASVLVLVFAVSTSAAIRQSHNLTEADTRQVAREWMLEHLPAGARVTREFYTPALDATPFKVRNMFALHGASYEDLAEKSDFIVLSSQGYARYYEDPHAYPDRLALYDRLLSLPHVFEVKPSSDLHGPSVVVVPTDPRAAEQYQETNALREFRTRAYAAAGAWVNENTLPGSRFVVPRAEMAELTWGRDVTWATLDGSSWVVDAFSKGDPAEAHAILAAHGVDYFVIQDPPGTHADKMPASGMRSFLQLGMADSDYFSLEYVTTDDEGLRWHGKQLVHGLRIYRVAPPNELNR